MSRIEIKQVFESLNIKATEKEIKKFIDYTDSNDDGEIGILKLLINLQ